MSRYCRDPIRLSVCRMSVCPSRIPWKRWPVDPRLHHRTCLLNIQLLSKCHLNWCSRFRAGADLVFPTPFLPTHGWHSQWVGIVGPLSVVCLSGVHSMETAADRSEIVSPSDRPIEYAACDPISFKSVQPFSSNGGYSWIFTSSSPLRFVSTYLCFSLTSFRFRYVNNTQNCKINYYFLTLPIHTYIYSLLTRTLS